MNNIIEEHSYHVIDDSNCVKHGEIRWVRRRIVYNSPKDASRRLEMGRRQRILEQRDKSMEWRNGWPRGLLEAKERSNDGQVWSRKWEDCANSWTILFLLCRKKKSLCSSYHVRPTGSAVGALDDNPRVANGENLRHFIIASRNVADIITSLINRVCSMSYNFLSLSFDYLRSPLALEFRSPAHKAHCPESTLLRP